MNVKIRQQINHFVPEPLQKFIQSTRADHKDYFYVRISNGCPSKCSYCAIKTAIGNLRSKPIHQCVSEFRKGLYKSNAKFMLVGDDVGAYGLDIGTNFPKLLTEICKAPGDYTLHLGETHPRWINIYYQDLKKIFLSTKINHVIIPIQSGSRNTLKAMKREEDIETTGQFILDLKRKRPDFILETHVIIGFPGETEQDFSQTLDFIQKVPFDSVWIYRFQSKHIAPASALPDQISEAVKTTRINKLQSLLIHLNIEHNQQA